VTADPHARPSRADQRAALALVRAMLTGDDQAAHDAAGSGSCPQCTAIAAASFGVAVVATLLGDGPLVSNRTRGAMLAAIASTEGELRSAGN
jgi:hypothetical protein